MSDAVSIHQNRQEVAEAIAAKTRAQKTTMLVELHRQEGVAVAMAEVKTVVLQHMETYANLVKEGKSTDELTDIVSRIFDSMAQRAQQSIAVHQGGVQQADACIQTCIELHEQEREAMKKLYDALSQAKAAASSNADSTEGADVVQITTPVVKNTRKPRRKRV